MKAVIYLFSIWLLLLTGLPCPDTDCHAHERKATATSHQAGNHEQDHQSPCSPFCHCTTCLGFSVPQPFSYMLTAHFDASAHDRQVFAYQSPNQTDVMFGIWQPPKL